MITLQHLKQIHAETMCLHQQRKVGGMRIRYFGGRKHNFLLQRAYPCEKLLTSPQQGKKKDPKKWFYVLGDPAQADTRLPRHLM